MEFQLDCLRFRVYDDITDWIMKREFIYRIWDKEQKKYTMTGSLYACEGLASLTQAFNRNTHTIEQYTGMKDKKDNMIFENDIVEIVDSYDGPYKALVTWDYYSFFEGDMPFGMLNDGPDVQVVGNINQNPDLVPKDDES